MTPWEMVAAKAMYNTGYLPEHRYSPIDGLQWALSLSASGVELSAHEDGELDALIAAFEDPVFVRLLQAAPTVSVHGPSSPSQWTPDTAARLAALPEQVERVVVHPWDGDPDPGMARLGARLLVENMDARKAQFGDVAGLMPWMTALPDARVCLDTAHLTAFADTERRGQDFIDAFGDRIAEVHTSGFTPPGRHVPMAPAHADAQWPILRQLTHLPWVLESTLA